MCEKKQYYGLDLLKFVLAIFVAERHVVQIYFGADSKWRILWNNWLSNLAVPLFFTIAGFFLFQKMETDNREANKARLSRYCKRILTMYLIWSVLYLPIDIQNFGGIRGITKSSLLSWLQSFFFCSTIPQLWYLPALAVACFLVWYAWEKGMKLWQLLSVGFLLFLCGYLMDNWYYNCRFPESLQTLALTYRKFFITPRNGIFYGIFYVALGFFFAKSDWRLPFSLSVFGSIFFIGCMYLEVTKITDAGSNTNFVFFAAPAAYCLFTAASALTLQPRKLYPRLRNMSEWIYLSHFYFFYFLTWTAKWNPIPFTSKSVTAMILGAVLLFAAIMSFWSDHKSGQWLKKLI